MVTTTTSAIRSPRSPCKRGQRLREAAEPGGKLALGAALVGVGVPAIDLGEGDLEADIGFDQLRDLLEVPAETALRVDGPVGGLVVGCTGLLEEFERVERFAGGAVQNGVDRRGVHAFKAVGGAGGASKGDGRIPGEAEGVEVADGKGILVALEAARGGRGHRDGAERGLFGGVLGAAAEHAIEPAVGHAAVFIDARFHEVLGLEVGARGVGRAASLDRREMALLEQRQQRGERRVEPEVAVEIERAVRARRLRGLRDADVGAGLIIMGIAVGHDHGEAVDRAALEDADEDFVAGRGAEVGRESGLAEKTGSPERPHSHDDTGERALFQKDPAIDVHHIISFFISVILSLSKDQFSCVLPRRN